MSAISQQSLHSLCWEMVSEACFHNNVHCMLAKEDQKKLEMYLVWLLNKFIADPRKIALLSEYLFTNFKDMISADKISGSIDQVQTLADAAFIRAGIFNRSAHTSGDLRLAQDFYGLVYQGKGSKDFFGKVYERFAINISPFALVFFDIRDGYIRKPSINSLIADCQQSVALNQRTIDSLKNRGIEVLDYIHADEKTIIQ